MSVTQAMLLVATAGLVIVGARLRGRPLTARLQRQATTVRGLVFSLICVNGILSGDSLVTKISIVALIITVVVSGYELWQLNPE